MQATWSLWATATHRTSLNQMHAAKQVVTSACQTTQPPNNGAILTTAQIIKAVRSSAAKAEVGALYINCRKAVPACHTLKFMGIHNLQRQCKQTTLQHLVLSMTTSSKPKIDGHEIPLAPQQNFLQTILTLLGPWQRKQWQLRDQTSCFHPSPSHTPNFSHTIHCCTNTTK